MAGTVGSSAAASASGGPSRSAEAASEDAASVGPLSSVTGSALPAAS
ncbi:hypothetical protein [Arthrobacter sp. RIT-PI-e]